MSHSPPIDRTVAGAAHAHLEAATGKPILRRLTEPISERTARRDRAKGTEAVAEPLPFTNSLSMAIRSLPGTRSRLMQIMTIAAATEERAKKLVWLWEQLAPNERRAVNLDELAEAADFPVADILALLTKTLYKHNEDVAQWLADLAKPKLMRKSIQEALRKGGGALSQKERIKFMEWAGYFPVLNRGGGITIPINQSQGTAVIQPGNRGGDPSLPRFEDRQRLIARTLLAEGSSTEPVTDVPPVDDDAMAVAVEDDGIDDDV